jgi:hypothetical protein
MDSQAFASPHLDLDNEPRVSRVWRALRCVPMGVGASR